MEDTSEIIKKFPKLSQQKGVSPREFLSNNRSRSKSKSQSKSVSLTRLRSISSSVSSAKYQLSFQQIKMKRTHKSDSDNDFPIKIDDDQNNSRQEIEGKIGKINKYKRIKMMSDSVSEEDDEVLPELLDDLKDDQINLTVAVDNLNDPDKKENHPKKEPPPSDFDLPMMRKNEEKLSKRRPNDIAVINDNDDIIAGLIGDMKHAAECDLKLFKQGKPAINKITILPKCLLQLKKPNLMLAFIEHNVLNVFTDWLAPLPGRSLPSFQVREPLLKLLADYPVIEQSILKDSGIGKAVMYLSKHPKETKENRERAGRLVDEWSRTVLKSSTNFKDISKEERVNKDLEQIQIPCGESSGMHDNRNRRDVDDDDELRILKPRDKGLIPRAQVPTLSNKVYVNRPKSTTDIDISKPLKRRMSCFQKHMKKYISNKRNNQLKRVATVSIEGKNMEL